MCCVIIVRPAGVVLARSIYEKCFANNDEGAGFAGLALDGSNLLHMEKGFFDCDELISAMEPYDKRELLIHFRASSPGMAINEELCHPFAFDSDPTHFAREDGKPLYQFALAHNGRLHYPNTKDESDTSAFVADVIAPHLALNPFFLDHYTGRYFLEHCDAVDKGLNKLAIMKVDTSTGAVKTTIINKGKGEVAHGCWFSNDYYRTERTVAIARGRVGVWTHYGASEYGPNSPWQKEQRELTAIEAQIKAERPDHYMSHLATDDDGWTWDFSIKKWENKRTKQIAASLPNRFIPIDVEAKRRLESRKLQEMERRETRRAARLAARGENVDMNCSHLKKGDWKRLKRLAETWQNDQYDTKVPSDNMDHYEAIRCLRADLYEADKSLNCTEALDRWLLKRGRPLDDLKSLLLTLEAEEEAGEGGTPTLTLVEGTPRPTPEERADIDRLEAEAAGREMPGHWAE